MVVRHAQFGHPPARPASRWPVVRRWGLVVLVAVIVVVVGRELLLVVDRLITSDLWFASVHAAPVYTTSLRARIGLFCVFGAVAALVGGLTVVAMGRMRAPLPIDAEDNPFRSMFRRYEPRVRPLIILAAAVIPAYLIGSRAASQWQTYLLWAHSAPWHATDPLFHKDISFFVEVYPFYALVVGLLSSAVAYGLWISVIGGYWYGGWRIRGGRRRITAGFTALLSALFAGYVALKAVKYWLARYGLTTSGRGPVTGASYADVHAALPSKYVLVGVAVAATAVLFANVLMVRRARILVGALAFMVLASVGIGRGWPDLAYNLTEAPSASKLDLAEIAHNQQATLTAFGLDGDITTVPYHPSSRLHSASLARLADHTAQIPLIDPNVLSPTFNVQQQTQAYYGFKSTLDIDHYDIGGSQLDVALAVRELNLNGIPHSSWVNDHLVYTHGYGIVAAPTDEMDPHTESPVFLDGGMPPAQQIHVTRPQIYFGQGFGSSSYAIVGEPSGSHKHLEFDHPGGNGSSASAHSTYRGHGGIPIGSSLRRALFALRLHSSAVFFSSELNTASQLLMVRNPAARVAKVAPWLTLDGDTYPVVADGHIDWVVDGYTTASTYPGSQMINLHTATATTLTADGASSSQPKRTINYLHNSVKAVVDAYTGKVTLYAWDQQRHPDPLLQEWESIFPGLVQPQSSIPKALLSHLRYPTDLFNVQRSLLAKYHVTQPADFYSGNDFWKVPTDPTVAANKQINAGSSSSKGTPAQPAEYISMSATGYGSQHYSLSSPMVTLNARELAAFVSVDAQPGPNYGKFTILDFPASSGGESPSQVENDIESNTTITEALTLQRGGDSTVVLGDLEAIPLAGRMLYVQPVYTQARGGNSFPILRHVIALYGNGDPSFADNLGTALSQALGSGGPAR